MTFAFTKYIYPLEKEILISKEFGYVIDNPRTEEEFEVIKKYINETIHNSKVDDKLPLITKYGLGLAELKDSLAKSNPQSYALKYYNSNLSKEISDIIAETWIIIRFQPSEEFDNILKDRDELVNLLSEDEKTPYSKSFEKLTNYCHIISLLINCCEEEYNGESFLLQENAYEIFFSSFNQRVYQALNKAIIYNYYIKPINTNTNWLCWLDGKDNLLSSCHNLELLLTQEKKIEGKVRASQKQTPKEKLMHIGSLLRASYSHHNDPELMLLLLVSIIEFIIIRNPDTSRFNVEDSISKQFKLKCAILIHSYNKSYDLQNLSTELNKIYSQRSDLAHGNYKENVDNKSIVDSVSKLYMFLAYILNEFISDRDLIDYLKDN